MWDLLLYAVIGFVIYKICKFAKAGAEDAAVARSMGSESDFREKGTEEHVNETSAVQSMNHK